MHSRVFQLSASNNIYFVIFVASYAVHFQCITVVCVHCVRCIDVITFFLLEANVVSDFEIGK